MFIPLILISVGNCECNCFCLFLPIPTDTLKPLQASGFSLLVHRNVHTMKHNSQKVEHETQRNSSTSKHYSWEEEHRLYIGSAWSCISEYRTSWEYKDHLFKPSQKLKQAQRPGFPTSTIKTSVCAQDSFKCKILAKT